MINPVRKKIGTRLNSEELDKIASADHEDIFAAPGIHRDGGSPSLVVRAFLPWAQTVSMVERTTGSVLEPIVKVHDAGIFEASLCLGD